MWVSPPQNKANIIPMWVENMPMWKSQINFNMGINTGMRPWKWDCLTAEDTLCDDGLQLDSGIVGSWSDFWLILAEVQSLPRWHPGVLSVIWQSLGQWCGDSMSTHHRKFRNERLISIGHGGLWGFDIRIRRRWNKPGPVSVSWGVRRRSKGVLWSTS